MNLNELAQVVAKKEKGKKEISIAQIKEVIKLVSDEMYLDPNLIKKMVNGAKRRSKK